MGVAVIVMVLLSAGSSGLEPQMVLTEELPAFVDGGWQLRSPVQHQRLIPSQGREAIPVPAMRLFTIVEQSLPAGSVESFSEHFAPSVSMQLRGGEPGYYSARQAYYILTSFLKVRKPVSVLFSTYGSTDGAPYATGAATFALKGMRENLQVYIALHKSGERWQISHLNIY